MKQVHELVTGLGGVYLSRLDAPYLHDLTERLVQKASIPVPRLFVISEEVPNAFALGTPQEGAAIGVTSGLLGHLDENELEAVLAHEVGHIKREHTWEKTRVALSASALSAAGGVAGGLLASSNIDFTPWDDDSGDLLSTLLKIGIGAAISAGAASTGRRWLVDVCFRGEFEADQYAGSLTQKPWALRRALLKLEELVARSPRSFAPEVAQLFVVCPASGQLETHPPTRERVQKLSMLPAPLHSAEVPACPTCFCWSCGRKTDGDGVYCMMCGERLEPGAPRPGPPRGGRQVPGQGYRI